LYDFCVARAGRQIVSPANGSGAPASFARWGKDFPRSGEDVTAGDKKGNTVGSGLFAEKAICWSALLQACGKASVLVVPLRTQKRVAAPSIYFAITRILLAAAPTTAPCFRRWRRSLLLQAIPSPALLPCGNRVPPQRTILRETPDTLAG